MYEEFSCGNQFNLINAGNKCNQDLCLIDKHFIELIRRELITDTNGDITSFQPKNDYLVNKCERINVAARDAKIMLGIDNFGKLDEEVDEAAAFDRLLDSWSSMMGLPTMLDAKDESNPKDIKYCTGEAPVVEIKSLEQIMAEGGLDPTRDSQF